MFKKSLDKLYYIYESIFVYISFFSFLYLKFHKPAVLKEINMLDVKKGDKILHIGCGAIPYSLIILSNETNAEEILGIDNQDKSIIQSITSAAKKNALATVAIFPTIMLLCYIGLMLYFKSIGGYKAVEITADTGESTSGDESASDV